MPPKEVKNPNVPLPSSIPTVEVAGPIVSGETLLAL